MCKAASPIKRCRGSPQGSHDARWPPFWPSWCYWLPQAFLSSSLAALLVREGGPFPITYERRLHGKCPRGLACPQQQFCDIPDILYTRTYAEIEKVRFLRPHAAEFRSERSHLRIHGAICTWSWRLLRLGVKGIEGCFGGGQNSHSDSPMGKLTKISASRMLFSSPKYLCFPRTRQSQFMDPLGGVHSVRSQPPLARSLARSLARTLCGHQLRKGVKRTHGWTGACPTTHSELSRNRGPTRGVVGGGPYYLF